MKINVKNFGDCPYCGQSLLNKLGVVSQCTQILTEDGFTDLDIEQALGYYCPHCGHELDEQLGEAIANSIEARGIQKDVKNA